MASELHVDAIKHSGGTSALTIDSSGRVSQPTKPSFQACNSTGSWATLSTGDVVPFNDVSSGNCFDVGGDFNTSSYRFVAPISGKYIFTFLCYSFNSDSVNAFRWWKNGSAMLTTSGGNYDMQGGQTNGAQDETISGTVIFDLSASDYVDVRSSTTSDYYGTYTHFGGHLIG
tara:strand:- start:1011 stop:1526 length:516 start_codon:yes stop_codon:yes gene_type:complete